MAIGEVTLDVKPDAVGFGAAVERAVEPQISKVGQGIAQKIGTGFESAGQRLSQAGTRLSVGLTLPFVAFAKKVDDEFAEVQRVSGQTAAAIESTGGAANVSAGEVQELSERIGELTVQDSELVQEAANVLLTFTNVRNEVGKGNDIFNQAALAAADLSARLGTDLSSATLQVGKALQDPIRGLTALRRVGVAFTEEQEEQIKTLVESGNTMKAQKLILAELSKEFGGSAEAAGKSASTSQKLSLAFANLAEKVGPILVPILAKIADAAGSLFEKFSNLDPKLQTIIVGFAAAAAAAGPVLKIFGPLVSITGRLISGIGSLAGALSKTTVAADGAAASTSKLSGAFTPLTAGAAAAAVGIGFIVQEHVKFDNATDALNNRIADATRTIVEYGAGHEKTAEAVAFLSENTDNAASIINQANRAHLGYLNTLTKNFSAAKDLASATQNLNDLTDRQRDKVAAAIVKLHGYGGSLTDAQAAGINNAIAIGDMNRALELLRDFAGRAKDRLQEARNTTDGFQGSAKAATKDTNSFADALANIPEKVRTNVGVEGIDAAKTAIDGFVGALGKIPSQKVVTVQAVGGANRTVTSTSFAPAFTTASAGAVPTPTLSTVGLQSEFSRLQDVVGRFSRFLESVISSGEDRRRRTRV